jgi:predicted HicB family RNase H-like nuclease
MACYTGGVKNVNVRVPDELHERVAAQAERDLRSLNSEILWLLALALDTLERQNREPRHD